MMWLGDVGLGVPLGWVAAIWRTRGTGPVATLLAATSVASTVVAARGCGRGTDAAIAAVAWAAGTVAHSGFRALITRGGERGRA